MFPKTSFRSDAFKVCSIFFILLTLIIPSKAEDKKAPAELKIGIIGLDTSHATAFAGMLNKEEAKKEDSVFKNARVIAIYKQGSYDIESSISRVPDYTKKTAALGVIFVNTIDELLSKVDAVLLETNDGRPHLEQVLPVLKAGKPVFVDKPIAGSLADAIAIFDAAKKYNTPLFSSSSLRYAKNVQEVRNGSIGEVLGCNAISPCSLNDRHPSLFWYGIHGVELLYTAMKPGCKTVVRTHTENIDTVTGTWEGGRVGIFRGHRTGWRGYAGTAFGSKKMETLGPYQGYKPLLVEIVKFFRTKKMPVDPAETLEIYTFMEAADESMRQGGKPVSMETVYNKAKKQAVVRLANLENINILTEKEKSQGWKLLFDGKNLTSWKNNNGKPVQTKVENGSIVPHKSGGYILYYDQPFGDFVFKCDVKFGMECNSGVFFRIGDLKNPVQTGFEVQVHSGYEVNKHQFGALYDLVAPSKNTSLGPGLWNSMIITCKGPEITVELNGEVVSKMNCDQYTTAGKSVDGTGNKYKKAIKDFPRVGYLGFQDHGHKVWYRNIKVLEIK